MNDRGFIEQESAAKAAEESQLNKPITLSLLLTFGLPTIFALLVMNTFTIVDGVFAMRRLGAEAMAAVSVVTPFAIIVIAIGIMFALGGSALVAKKSGMGLKQEARQNFTLLCIVALVVSSLVAAFAAIFPETLLELLGANYEIMELATTYLRIFALSIPLVTVSQVFNQFLIADGKPMLGMGVSLLGSSLSAGLNAIFLFGLDMGIEGLALASLIGYSVTSLIGFLCFVRNKKGTLYFVRPGFDIGAIGVASLNGFGAFVNTVVAAVVTIVMNNVLVRMDGVGAMGVAVAGMVMGVHATLASVFFGYLSGISPLISYNYGNRNHDRQKKLFKYNLRIIAIISLIALGGALALSDLLIRIYVPAGTELHAMAVRGLRIAAMSFLMFGFNAFAVSHFSALNKGLIAGVLSTVRTLGLNLPLLLVLPRFFDLTGVWAATPISEVLALTLSTLFLLVMGKRYHYLGKGSNKNNIKIMAEYENLKNEEQNL